jgi:hypothetical protein
MDRREFFFLYANANSIAELALRQSAERVFDQPVEPSVPADLTQEELEAQVLASFDNLDLTALDNLDIGAFDASAESSHVPARETSEPFALDRYLDRAYAAESELRARVDALFGRADHAALQSDLDALPRELPPLTGLLSARDMTQWLEHYERGNDALNSLVVRIRQLPGSLQD